MQGKKIQVRKKIRTKIHYQSKLENFVNSHVLSQFQFVKLARFLHIFFFK